jgi:nucleotide-binding universal stress UspA family protein
MATREQVELRAYRIWQEAGCPEGSSLAHWLQAELELGVIDPEGVERFAQLDALAAAAGAEEGLRESVDAAVPPAERLPGAAEENPLSEHVEDIARGRPPRPGARTFEGGERVPG